MSDDRRIKSIQEMEPKLMADSYEQGGFAGYGEKLVERYERYRDQMNKVNREINEYSEDVWNSSRN